MPLTVERTRIVAADPPKVWRHLTEPALLTEWFATVEELAEGRPFRFDFGDGDYFAGTVLSCRAASGVALTWRFMDVGPEFRIHWTVQPAEEGTLVRVSDHGALTEDEAEGLREGWDDFLARLATCVLTGERARYRWTPAIGAAAFVETGDDALAALRDPDWWAEAFPGARVTRGPDGAPEALRLELGEDAWGGVRTTVTARIQATSEGERLIAIGHAGWDLLPDASQVAERRRYAERWARALQRLERRPCPAAP